MKIALVSQEYPPETARGGIGTQTYVKAQGLAALGHEVFVISRSVDGDRHQQRDGNIFVIRIPGMEDKLSEMTEPVQWITHSVVVAQELDALQKRSGLDLIDFPEWAAEGYVYLLNRTAWNNVAVVIQLHGPLVMFANTMGWPEMDSEFYRTGTAMEATCVRLADSVYSSSECSAEWIRSHYHAQIGDIPIIHLGIDTNKFIPQPHLKGERPVIVFVGKIVPNKGVEELVDACAELVKIFPHLQLRLIGGGDASYLDKLRHKARLPDGTSFLEFKGYIHKEDLPDELAKATVFAAPSWYEGGPGFVYLEAMACGLPVVACSGSGIDEIVTNEVNGLLVPPKNWQALKEALAKILSNKTMAENMGANARNFVLQESDSRDCLKKLELFYKAVIKSHAQKNSN
jgi:glycosyltransferase involved in cell wall biosynthesis